ncbi:hypothetical protein SAMN05421856_107181 [Chryseobacterium taichungense]|uniref:Uncharacterized protein n=1 Tax=Chryseobacterium taichungense TaxID=295069 RepID=A0A1H8BSL2_9FLAO|nr:hypothetical protein SAMN05421856_107181 [Chryseobacterium taichungense]
MSKLKFKLIYKIIISTIYPAFNLCDVVQKPSASNAKTLTVNTFTVFFIPSRHGNFSLIT